MKNLLISFLTLFSLLNCANAQNFSERHDIVNNNEHFVMHRFTIDWDNDGYKDFLVFGKSSLITLYRNANGQGFESPVTLFVDESGEILGSSDLWYSKVYLEDANDDGLLDVYTISDNALHFLENNGNELVYDSLLLDPGAIQGLFDINQDGRLDLIQAINKRWRWYESVGNGEFSDFEEISDLNDYSDSSIDSGDGFINYFEEDAFHLAFDDLNGDGVLDQIVWIRESIYNEEYGYESHDYRMISLISNGTSWSLESMPGDFYFSVTDNVLAYYYRSGDYVSGVFYPANIDIEFHDFNGDGFTDIYKIENNVSSVAFSDGTDSLPNDFQILTPNISEFRPAHLVDINNDGLTDVIYEHDNTLQIRLNEDGLNFTSVTYETNMFIGGVTQTKPFVFEDFDNNGLLDILVYHFEFTEVDRPMIIYQSASGIFDEPIPLQEVPLPSVLYGSHKIIDVNNDGLTDLIYAERGGYGYFGQSRLSYFEQIEPGVYDQERLISHFTSKVFDVADIDGNGSEDIVFIDKENPKLAYLSNLDNGAFDEKQILYGMEFTNALQLFCTDYDLDGDIDVIVAQVNHDIDFLQNEGNFQFSHTTFEDIECNGAISLDDYNQDGRPDILFVTSSNFEIGELKLALGKEDGFELIHIGQQFFANEIAVSKGDMDNDGDLDIMISKRTINSWDTEESLLLEQIDESTWLPILPQENTPSFINGLCGDSDNDGFAEFFFHSSENDLRSYRNLGFLLNNQFPNGNAEAEASRFSKMELVDMDQDGDLDLLAGLSSFRGISWFENKIEAPAISFEISPCPNFEIFNFSVGDFSELTFNWDFGNGVSSTEPYPEYPIDIPLDLVSLTACGPLGCETVEQQINIDQYTIETSSTMEGEVGAEINFVSPFQGYSNYSWVFGDGEVSFDQNASHIYAEQGVYTIEHFATENSIVDCTLSFSHEVQIGAASSASNNLSNALEVRPNPSTGLVEILLPSAQTYTIVEVLSIDGKTMYREKLEDGQIKLDLAQLQSGIYFVKVKSDQDSFLEMLILY